MGVEAQSTDNIRRAEQAYQTASATTTLADCIASSLSSHTGCLSVAITTSPFFDSFDSYDSKEWYTSDFVMTESWIHNSWSKNNVSIANGELINYFFDSFAIFSNNTDEGYAIPHKLGEEVDDARVIAVGAMQHDFLGMNQGVYVTPTL